MNDTLYSVFPVEGLPLLVFGSTLIILAICRLIMGEESKQ